MSHNSNHKLYSKLSNATKVFRMESFLDRITTVYIILLGIYKCIIINIDIVYKLVHCLVIEGQLYHCTKHVYAN